MVNNRPTPNSVEPSRGPLPPDMTSVGHGDVLIAGHHLVHEHFESCGHDRGRDRGVRRRWNEGWRVAVGEGDLPSGSRVVTD